MQTREEESRTRAQQLRHLETKMEEKDAAMRSKQDLIHKIEMEDKNKSQKLLDIGCEINALRNTADVDKKELEDRIGSVNREKDEIFSKMRETESLLKQKAIELADKDDDLSQRLIEKTESMKKLSDLNNNLISTIEQKENFINSLTKEHEAKISTLTKLSTEQGDKRELEIISQISIKETKIAQLEEQIKTSEDKLTHGLKCIESSSTEVRELNDQLSKMKKNATQIQDENSTLKKQLTSLDEELRHEKEQAVIMKGELKRIHDTVMCSLQEEMKALTATHKRDILDTETRAAESETNYQLMLSNLATRTKEQLKAKDVQMASNESAQATQIKVKEELIISLMDSVQEKVQELAFKKIENDELVQSHNDRVKEVLVEREELLDKLRESSEKLCHLESDLSVQNDAYVQKTTDDQVSRDKCNDLEGIINKVRSENNSIKLDYSNQSKEFELLRNDLLDLKESCKQLQETIFREKDEHTEALKACAERHAEELKQQTVLYLSKHNILTNEKQKVVLEKETLLCNTQKEHQKLLEDNQSMEEEHTVLVSQLQSDVATYKHQIQINTKQHELDVNLLNRKIQEYTSQIVSLESNVKTASHDNEETRLQLNKEYDTKIANLSEDSIALSKKVEGYEAEVTMLQNRLQDITLANEMLKIDQSRAKKDYSGQLGVVNKELSDMTIKKQDLAEHMSSLSSRMEERVARVKSLETEIIALKEEHSDHACFLEDKITNLQGTSQDHELLIASTQVDHDKSVEELRKQITDARLVFDNDTKKCKIEYSEKIEAIELENKKLACELAKCQMESISKTEHFTEKNSLETELKQLEQSTSSTINDMQSRLSETESALTKAKESLAALQIENSSKVESLRSEVTTLKTSVEVLEAAVASSSGDKTQLEVKVVQLQEQVRAVHLSWSSLFLWLYINTFPIRYSIFVCKKCYVPGLMRLLASSRKY